MILINCTENCIHQKDGMCTLDHVGKISNTTSTGCEFYVENKIKTNSMTKAPSSKDG